MFHYFKCFSQTITLNHFNPPISSFSFSVRDEDYGLKRNIRDIITNICIHAFGRLFNPKQPKQKYNWSLHALPGIWTHAKAILNCLSYRNTTEIAGLIVIYYMPIIYFCKLLLLFEGLFTVSNKLNFTVFEL